MKSSHKRPVIAIIGGGAAGLFAAVTLALSEKHPYDILLFERQERLGKKLLATGNGRCNLSNLSAQATDYGQAAPFVEPAFQALSPQKTLEIFRRLGLLTRKEADGKVYPYSNQGSAVLDILRLQCQYHGVHIQTDAEVQQIQRHHSMFRLLTSTGQQFAHKVILATGGCAAPQLGGTKSGYALGEALGHVLTPLFPALVQVKTDSPYPKALKGVKFEGIATLKESHHFLAQESGEVLFTEYGLSGPPLFRLSRFIGQNSSHKQPKPLTIFLDLMPEYSTDALLSLLLQQQKALHNLPCEHFLTSILQKRLGQMTLKAAGIAPLSRLCATLKPAELSALVQQIKAFPFPVRGTTGWANAQVTAGGLALQHFVPTTLESRLQPGLYAVGELLDVDGPCGGYNLQWAWSSGYLAAISASRDFQAGGEQQ